MVAGLRHPDWYLVAEQKFRRRAGIREGVQSFRGEEFLVLADGLTGQYLRLGQQAMAFWRQLDGALTVDRLWRLLSRSADTAASQREVMNWVMQLVSAGMILSDHAIDPAHLSDRTRRRRDKMLEQKAANPLAIKIPLFDPQPILRATYPLARLLFTPFGALAILVLICSGLLAAILHWDSILSTADTSLLQQSGLVAMFLSYPLMKILHEMGHGWAVMRYGGEVREAGIMLLLFVPVPYVDASSATAFPDPRARMLVGAAGIIAELMIAAAALLLWLQIEPGVGKAVLYSLVVMGSLSTLLFNGNPLLKFDAYYVLSDWLQIPNLATRASACLSEAVRTRLFGLRPQDPVPAGEGGILLTYGILALIYRLMLTSVIVLLVWNLFYALGVALAIWALVSSVIWPLWKFFSRSWQIAGQQNRQSRLSRRWLAFLVVGIGFGGFVPLPFSAEGRGVVILSERAAITAGANGFLAPGAVADGSRVEAGAPLLLLENPDQAARLEASKLLVLDLEQRLQRGGLGVLERADLAANLAHAQQSLADGLARDAERELLSPYAGQVAWAGGRAPIAGGFYFKGDRLGGLIAPDLIEVQLTIPAAFAGQVPALPIPVKLRLPDGSEITRSITRLQVFDRGAEIPAALLVPNGGSIPAQPDQQNRALTPTIVGWIAPEGDLTDALGMRVEARIDLPPKPLFGQMLFHLERLFLRVTRW